MPRIQDGMLVPPPLARATTIQPMPLGLRSGIRCHIVKHMPLPQSSRAWLLMACAQRIDPHVHSCASTFRIGQRHLGCAWSGLPRRRLDVRMHCLNLINTGRLPPACCHWVHTHMASTHPRLRSTPGAGAPPPAVCLKQCDRAPSMHWKADCAVLRDVHWKPAAPAAKNGGRHGSPHLPTYLPASGGCGSS